MPNSSNRDLSPFPGSDTSLNGVKPPNTEAADAISSVLSQHDTGLEDLQSQVKEATMTIARCMAQGAALHQKRNKLALQLGEIADADYEYRGLPPKAHPATPPPPPGKNVGRFTSINPFPGVAPASNLGWDD